MPKLVGNLNAKIILLQEHNNKAVIHWHMTCSCSWTWYHKSCVSMDHVPIIVCSTSTMVMSHLTITLRTFTHN
jgi:hypothetical protein